MSLCVILSRVANYGWPVFDCLLHTLFASCFDGRKFFGQHINNALSKMISEVTVPVSKEPPYEALLASGVKPYIVDVGLEMPRRNTPSSWRQCSVVGYPVLANAVYLVMAQHAAVREVQACSEVNSCMR